MPHSVAEQNGAKEFPKTQVGIDQHEQKNQKKYGAIFENPERSLPFYPLLYFVLLGRV